MGGRNSDNPGTEFTHPFEYDPGTNAWTIKSATYPDIQVNNIACGVLNESGTDYIYCVGGSDVASQTTTGRVFRYDPVTDTISYHWRSLAARRCDNYSTRWLYRGQQQAIHPWRI